MNSIFFLILYPLAIALFVRFIKNDIARNGLVIAGALGVAAGSVELLITNFHSDIIFFKVESLVIDYAIIGLEVLVGLFILWQSFRFRKPFVAVLVIVQVAMTVFAELSYGHHVVAEHNLFMDKLSIMMALIIGVIGGLICVHALGYMRDLHMQHTEFTDDRPTFFFVIFLFLSAMFGVVFANNLVWLYFFWEITTLCSFLLIGYKKTEESRKNAFWALTLNLLGGLAFAGAIVYLYASARTIELDKILAMGKGAVLIPVALMSFAGLTKSAQFPFSSWLLGAMVAPTPVSALLHSGTMVKAGVYIIMRFASVLQGTLVGFIIAAIGGVTFLMASFIAISHRDAKRVLAWSTIANLGLIVLCAGVGTYEALWAGAFLIIFHAVAKCLLFLCVGTIEHRIHSRDIEHMTGLIISLPKISIMIQIGMAGMFLAPFGMLISKWAVLRALVDFNPLLAVFVVFGSGATLFFWVKWIGKLLIVTEEKDAIEEHVSKYEMYSLGVLAFLTIGVCGFFPVVSSVLIEPYVIEIYGKTFSMGQGNIIIMLMMLVMVMLFPLSFINYGKKVKVVDAYLGGANMEMPTQFRGSIETVKNMGMANYYLEKYFGETRLANFSIIICSLLTVGMLVASCLSH